MFGAIVGDIAGSKYEWNNIRHEPAEIFSAGCVPTDDTVLTLATYEYLSRDRRKGKTYAEVLREFWDLTPDVGYGPMFARWAATPGLPASDSFGNGAAMRISPVAMIRTEDLQEKLQIAKELTLVSHGHPEAVKGAQALVHAIHLAAMNPSPAQIKAEIEKTYGYRLDYDLDDLRKNNTFDATCPVTVPQAIWIALLGTSFEDVIKKAISIGGDSDTIACMAGGIAEARFPLEVMEWADTAVDLICTAFPDRIRNPAKRMLLEVRTVGYFEKRLSTGME